MSVTGGLFTCLYSLPCILYLQFTIFAKACSLCLTRVSRFLVYAIENSVGYKSRECQLFVFVCSSMGNYLYDLSLTSASCQTHKDHAYSPWKGQTGDCTRIAHAAPDQPEASGASPEAVPPPAECFWRHWCFSGVARLHYIQIVSKAIGILRSDTRYEIILLSFSFKTTYHISQMQHLLSIHFENDVPKEADSNSAHVVQLCWISHYKRRKYKFPGTSFSGTSFSFSSKTVFRSSSNRVNPLVSSTQKVCIPAPCNALILIVRLTNSCKTRRDSLTTTKGAWRWTSLGTPVLYIKCALGSFFFW